MNSCMNECMLQSSNIPFWCFFLELLRALFYFFGGLCGRLNNAPCLPKMSTSQFLETVTLQTKGTLLM